ncbi:MAG: glutamate--tRNA ligase, partial [Firmicutes bacterium]|nr:glutamate--tRNA ligase [Bacillota bacterium]
KMPATAIYDELLAWAESYDAEFAALLKADKDYACRIIDLGRDGDRPRKDLVHWAQAAKFLSFYYAERFQLEDAFPAMDEELRREILRRYLATVDFADDNSAWFDKVKVICGDLGFALQPKLYKKNPELYPGSIADVSNVIRVAVTGRSNSPDLWQICKLIGEAEMRRRCEAAINM